MNMFLLASGDPFRHTWNTWEIDLFGLKLLDLRHFPKFERLGFTNAVVQMCGSDRSGEPERRRISLYSVEANRDQVVRLYEKPSAHSTGVMRAQRAP